MQAGCVVAQKALDQLPGWAAASMSSTHMRRTEAASVNLGDTLRDHGVGHPSQPTKLASVSDQKTTTEVRIRRTTQSRGLNEAAASMTSKRHSRGFTPTPPPPNPPTHRIPHTQSLAHCTTSVAEEGRQMSLTLLPPPNRRSTLPALGASRQPMLSSSTHPLVLSRHATPPTTIPWHNHGGGPRQRLQSPAETAAVAAAVRPPDAGATCGGGG